MEDQICYLNYVDDTTLNINANNTADVIEKVKYIVKRPFTWFGNNQMKENHEKYYLLLRTQEDANVQISKTTINCLRSQILLGIVFYNKVKTVTKTLRMFVKNQIGN